MGSLLPYWYVPGARLVHVDFLYAPPAGLGIIFISCAFSAPIKKKSLVKLVHFRVEYYPFLVL
jgi:hypothetical protein